MSLATVGMSGNPSVRIVLMKGVDEDGFVFYTNLDGRKGRELRTHPVAAINFHWFPLEVQVRAEGPVSQVSDEEADAYFASRPRESQIGAWASEQSAEIPDKDWLRQRVTDVEARFAGGPVTRPPFWGGYRLRPDAIEFWQQGANRLHDRIVYRHVGSAWERVRLSP